MIFYNLNQIESGEKVWNVNIQQVFFIQSAAYILWGILPIYWKFLDGVPALEILAHRVIWSFIFVLLIVLTFEAKTIKELLSSSNESEKNMVWPFTRFFLY